MSVTTTIRRFKISVETFDAFLSVNGINETDGAPRFFHDHPDDDPVAALLYSRIAKAGGTANKKKFHLITPLRKRFTLSRVAYVTYAWLNEIPKGFKELRKEILSYGKEEPLEINKIPNNGEIRIYTVYTDEPYRTYFSNNIKDRIKEHRMQVHGAKDGFNPLPEV
ncbi:hypothetical protein B0T10DRAFT_534263 [Thelonectria olida]|uniref:Uncharacterized protein n=1 Tax=Thelonectria olida TaxID=1576542 RepID=A0A9P8VLU0_9HYPO|nr:hypothetical protein B0T10DRAFT_534263 [Thelonectria olida]